jgi:hypothetical protein
VFKKFLAHWAQSSNNKTISVFNFDENGWTSDLPAEIKSARACAKSNTSFFSAPSSRFHCALKIRFIVCEHILQDLSYCICQRTDKLPIELRLFLESYERQTIIFLVLLASATSSCDAAREIRQHLRRYWQAVFDAAPSIHQIHSRFCYPVPNSNLWSWFFS